jgi:hypothetical protein
MSPFWAGAACAGAALGRGSLRRGSFGPGQPAPGQLWAGAACAGAAPTACALTRRGCVPAWAHSHCVCAHTARLRPGLGPLPLRVRSHGEAASRLGPTPAACALTRRSCVPAWAHSRCVCAHTARLRPGLSPARRERFHVRAQTYRSTCPAGLPPLPRKSGPAGPATDVGSSQRPHSSVASPATQAPTFCGEGGWGGGV